MEEEKKDLAPEETIPETLPESVVEDAPEEVLESSSESSPEPKPKKGAKEIFKTVFFSFMWLGVLFVVIDQCTKWGVYHLLEGREGNKVTIIPGFLEFQLYFNKGMSYGFLSDGVGWRIVLCIISWVASGVIAYFWGKNLKKNDLWMNAIWALIFAGALGNGIDRAFYWESIAGFDGVIDFIVIYFFGPNNQPPFGVFNFADACLSIGVVMFIIVYIVRMIKASRKEKRR